MLIEGNLTEKQDIHHQILYDKVVYLSVKIMFHSFHPKVSQILTNLVDKRLDKYLPFPAPPSLGANA